MTTISWRLFKAITTSRLQRITVSPDRIWVRALVYFGTGKHRKMPGTELGGFFIAICLGMMAIGNHLYDIDQVGILKIGIDKAYNMRRDFETKLKATTQRTQIQYIHKII